MRAASKILGEPVENEHVTKVEVASISPSLPPDTETPNSPVTRPESVSYEPPESPHTEDLSAVSEKLPEHIFEKSPEKPSTSSSSLETPTDPAKIVYENPAVSQISNDHDYLVKKLSHLQRNLEQGPRIRDRIAEINRITQACLDGDTSGGLIETINQVAQIVEEEMLYRPETEVVERNVSLERPNSPEQFGQLISEIVKEEYDYVDLPANEPDIDESDHEAPEAEPEPGLLELANQENVRLLKEFGNQILQNADGLAGKSPTDINEYFVQLRKKLAKIESDFGCAYLVDANSQVSQKDFIKMNENAKRNLLENLSSDEEEEVDAESTPPKVKKPKRTHESENGKSYSFMAEKY